MWSRSGGDRHRGRKVILANPFVSSFVIKLASNTENLQPRQNFQTFCSGVRCLSCCREKRLNSRVAKCFNLGIEPHRKRKRCRSKYKMSIELFLEKKKVIDRKFSFGQQKVKTKKVFFFFFFQLHFSGMQCPEWIAKNRAALRLCDSSRGPHVPRAQGNHVCMFSVFPRSVHQWHARNRSERGAFWFCFYFSN